MLAGSVGRVDAARRRIAVPAQAQRLPVIIDTEIGGEPDDAIALAIAARELPELALVVTSDVVNVDAGFGRDTAITAASPVYRELADGSAPGWTRVLAAHCAQFFARYHPAVIPASPLTLSAALHLPFAHFRGACVSVDRAGRMREDHQGSRALMSSCPDGPAFSAWLHAKLRPAAWPERPASAGSRRRSPASVT